MQTEVIATPHADTNPPIASPWHTGLVLAVMAILAFRGNAQADHMRTLANPSHVAIYVRTIFFEWLVFGLVMAGVWLRGSSLRALVGGRWRRLGQVLRDVGIGVLFLIASIVVTSVAGGHAQGEKAARFLMPQGVAEMVLWVALSISAGFCEEAVYRGYLQKQFMALTKNVPAGIVLSAMAFGPAHLYQGYQQAFQIALLGVMAGILAYWCRSLRPGMIAHTLQDVLGGLAQH